MDFELFKKSHISLLTQHFEHPVYPQLWKEGDSKEFVSHLSVIDLLFNCGKDSLKVLKAQMVS